MSKTTSQVTINALIPIECITKFEKELLRNHGISPISKLSEEDQELLYFLASDGFEPNAKETCIEGTATEDPALEAREDTFNSFYFNKGGELDYENAYEIFQNIIKRSDDLTYVSVSGAYINHDYELGNTESFVVLISEDNILIKSSADMLNEMQALMENPRALIPDQENETDYVLADNQKSTWITVDDISVYVRRDGAGVSIDTFPAGQEGKPPLDSIYTELDSGLSPK